MAANNISAAEPIDLFIEYLYARPRADRIGNSSLSVKPSMRVPIVCIED